MLDFQQHLEGSPLPSPPHLLCAWPHPWGLSAQSDGSWEGWLLECTRTHARGWSSALANTKAPSHKALLERGSGVLRW